MTKPKGEKAQASRKAKQLRDQLRSALNEGDYHLAGRLSDELQTLLPDSEFSREASKVKENFKLERSALIVGGGASLVWVLGFLLTF